MIAKKKEVIFKLTYAIKYAIREKKDGTKINAFKQTR